MTSRITPELLAHLRAWEGRSETRDEVLLFRYSALTFNGHCIHYDRPYATAVEGYDGLVVHGPLIATLLADLVLRERPDAILRTFSFRTWLQRPALAGVGIALACKLRSVSCPGVSVRCRWCGKVRWMFLSVPNA